MVPRRHMVEALAIAVLSVAFGAFLGLSNALGKRVLGAIQTFGLAAAIGLVLLQLLPEAFARLGWVALVIFVVASRAPSWLESLVHRAARRDRGHAIGLDLAYVGFAIHQVADGVSMGTFTEGAHAHHDHGDYFLAIAGHTIPLTALFVGMIAVARGKRAALLCAAGLAFAVALGIVLPGLVDTRFLARADAWVGAIAAGLLFHAVGHARPDEPETRASRPDHAHGAHHHDHDHAHHAHAHGHGLETTSPAMRALDLAAAALGFGLAILGEHGHGGGEHVHGDATHTLADAVVFTAPLAAIALGVGVVFARRRAGVFVEACRLSAEWILPWFVIASLIATALLTVNDTGIVDRLPAAVRLGTQGLAAVLALVSLGLMYMLGARTFLLRPLRSLNAHGDHDHAPRTSDRPAPHQA